MDEAIGWRRQREPHRDRENWTWSEKSLFVRLALFDLLCIHNTYTYLEHLIATDRFKLALYQLIQLIVGFGMMDDCSGNYTVISQHIKRLLYDLMISIDYIACRYFSFWLMVCCCCCYCCCSCCCCHCCFGCCGGCGRLCVCVAYRLMFRIWRSHVLDSSPTLESHEFHFDEF